MISFSEFSLRRGNKLLFENVNLTIHKQQKVGLTGANGCGKSSLFAVFRNELHADTGELDMPPNLTIAHVLQETPALAVAAIDYVMQGDEEWFVIQQQIEEAEAHHQNEKLGPLYAELEAIDGYSAPTRAAKLMSGLGFPVEDMQRPVKDFSGGWRMRLNLGRALMCRSDLLLLDEPTNHLDLDTVFWLEEWLKSYPGTLMLISHDRDFLDSITSHILHIENQGVDLYTGNYSFFEKARHEKLILQQSAYEKQQGEIKQLQRFIDRFRAKATKARQVQSRIKSLEKMQQIAAVHEHSLFKFQFKPVQRMPNPVIQMDNIQLGYGESTILEQIQFNLYPGARIGLLGHNGAGKSTFIKFLAGELKPLLGELSIPEDLKIGYFAQHQLEQLNGQDTPIEFIQRLDKTAIEQSIRDFLGSFGFAKPMAESCIEPFSGGEKSRLVLAALVYQAPALLLMDEPTNHLDLETRDALSFALQAYQGAMVVVSHDRHLLNSITDEFYLVADKRVSYFKGDLTDYRDYLAEQQSLLRQVEKEKGRDELGSAFEANEPIVRNKKEQRRQAAEKRQKLQPLTKQLKNLEQELEKLSEEKEKLETELSKSELYSEDNKQQLKELLVLQAENSRLLEETEEHWMEISEELEELAESS